MSYNNRNQIIDADQLNIKNKSTRLPIFFCVESTKDFPTAVIQEQLINFLSEIKNNDDLSSCADIAIMQYDTTQKVVRAFSLINSTNEAISIKMSDTTNFADLGSALMNAIKKIKIHIMDYKTLNRNYYAPTIILFSSGKFDGEMQKALDTICGLKESGTLHIIPFVHNSDNKSFFEKISVSGDVFSSSATGYERLFDQIKKSMHTLSTSSGNAYKSLLNTSKEWDNFKLR